MTGSFEAPSIRGIDRLRVHFPYFFLLLGEVLHIA
jgi:hypothetical protein